MKNNWSYNEFLAFALLYASHADIEYSREEKNVIESLVPNEKYKGLYDLFSGMSDYSALQAILSYKSQYFDTVDKKNNLLSKIKELFHADGHYSSIENEFYLFLEKLL